MLDAEDRKMNETIAALQKCVVEIRRERMDVRSPFGRVLQNTHVEVPPESVALAT